MGKRVTIVMVLLGLVFNAFSQTRLIKGTVTDDSNISLPGVVVSTKSNEISTRTNESGYYSIEIPDDIVTLVFSHPDMKTSSISIGDSDVIDARMIPTSSSESSELSLEDLMNIKINIASSNAENIFNTASTVSVIDRKSIDAYSFRTIAEALQTVPGFDVYRSYLKRNLPTARGVLQDNYANKVLFMINGVPTWNAVTGEGFMDRINIDDVERIEVLKGPSSVLYGSNAFSGAVNIVLREKADYKNATYGTVGTNGKLGIGSEIILQSESRNLLISGNIETENGYEYTFHDELDSINEVNEYLTTKNFTASLQDKNYNLLLNYYQAEESYLGVTPSFSAGAGNPHKLKGFLASFSTSYNIFNPLKLKYLLNYDWNFRDLSRAASDDVRARIDGYRLVNQASLLLTPNEVLSLELGGSTEYKFSKTYENYFVPSDTMITGNNMKGISSYTYAAFGFFNYSKGKFNLTMGSRFTYNELFKNNLSSRITLVYKLGDRKSLKAIYGESFRSPSLFEQNFTTTTFTVVGNTDLVPEKSKSMELLYVQSFNKWFIQTTLYHAIYENTIFRDQQYYEPAGKTVSIYANGSEFAATGVEMELRYINPAVVNGFFNLNYIAGNKSDKIGEHYNFKYVPKYTCAMGLNKQIKNFSVSSDLILKGATEGPNERIDAMYMVNAGLGYRHQLFGQKVIHSLTAKNINNSEYLIPEYIRRTVINSVPYGYFRSIAYTLRMEL